VEEKELPRWLDGPKFIAFLLSEGVVKGQQSDATIRRWTDWERGSRADRYGAADRVMTENLISERMIPDDVWADDQNYLRKTSPKVLARKSKGLEMIDGGKTYREVASILGVSRTTVRRWQEARLTEQVG
jgi:hypothetical protein